MSKNNKISRWQLIKTLRKHIKLSEKRSAAFNQNKIAKAVVYVMAAFIVFYLMFFAVILALVANSSNHYTACEVFFGVLPFILGVDFFFRRLAQEKGDVRSLSRCLFAVIGEKTAEALAAHGIRADLCPGVFTGKALAQALLRRLAPEETVYLFDSVRGSRVIPETLAEQGISCRRISLYDTIYETVPQTERLQYILFGSAGGVNALADDGYEWDGDTTPICIGPVCARTFENRFHQRPLVSPNITAESMVETLLTHSSSKM